MLIASRLLALVALATAGLPGAPPFLPLLVVAPAVALWDWHTREIPDHLIWPTLAAILILQFRAGGLPSLGVALLAGAGGFTLLFLLGGFANAAEDDTVAGLADGVYAAILMAAFATPATWHQPVLALAIASSIGVLIDPLRARLERRPGAPFCAYLSVGVFVVFAALRAGATL